MNKEKCTKIYIDFMEDLINIGIENIQNGLIFNTPEEQLMDSLEEFNQNLKEDKN